MGRYNSCGNGSAVRISAVGWASGTKEECIAMSRTVTVVTHNHSDGIKGAKATALQIFLAFRENMSLKELKKFEEEEYYSLKGYDFKTLEKSYSWHSLCDGTCQAAFSSLYESVSFEDAIRNFLSIGVDTDTTSAICDLMAEAVYPTLSTTN